MFSSETAKSIPEHCRNFTIPEWMADEPPFEPPNVPGSSLDELAPIIIVPRSAWSTGKPTRVIPRDFPIPTVKFSSKDIYSLSEHFAKGMKMMEEVEMDQFKAIDVPFNFLVAEGGLIYEGRGWNAAPSYTEKTGVNVLEIAFVGNYQPKWKMASWELCDAAHSLITLGVEQKMIDPKFTILGMKSRSRFSEDDLKWFDNHDTDLAPDPLPYNH